VKPVRIPGRLPVGEAVGELHLSGAADQMLDHGLEDGGSTPVHV
jgi:hypothetical protein